MRFLQDPNLRLYTSEKYENIYTTINNEFKTGYKSIFLLSATLGARKGIREPFEKLGREFRVTYLNEEEEHLAYTIILNDAQVGKDINLLDDNEFRMTGRNVLQEYAEGGMADLVENVFKEKWNGFILDPHYKDYGLDMMKYLIAEINEVPF